MGSCRAVARLALLETQADDVAFERVLGEALIGWVRLREPPIAWGGSLRLDPPYGSGTWSSPPREVGELERACPST